MVMNGWLVMINVGKTLPCLPRMAGNGKHSTYENGDDWGDGFMIVLPTLHQMSHWNSCEMLFVHQEWSVGLKRRKKGLQKCCTAGGQQPSRHYSGGEQGTRHWGRRVNAFKDQEMAHETFTDSGVVPSWLGKASWSKATFSHMGSPALQHARSFFAQTPRPCVQDSSSSLVKCESVCINCQFSAVLELQTLPFSCHVLPVLGFFVDIVLPAQPLFCDFKLCHSSSQVGIDVQQKKEQQWYHDTVIVPVVIMTTQPLVCSQHQHLSHSARWGLHSLVRPTHLSDPVTAGVSVSSWRGNPQSSSSY